MGRCCPVARSLLKGRGGGAPPAEPGQGQEDTGIQDSTTYNSHDSRVCPGGQEVHLAWVILKNTVPGLVKVKGSFQLK